MKYAIQAVHSHFCHSRPEVFCSWFPGSRVIWKKFPPYIAKLEHRKFSCNAIIFDWEMMNLWVTCYIWLSRKFMRILKENWNSEDLNFSVHLLNYVGILFYNSLSFKQLENSIHSVFHWNLSGFSVKNLSRWFFFLISIKELKLFPLTH